MESGHSASWHDCCFDVSRPCFWSFAMSLNDASHIIDQHDTLANSDFTLLEGLYQLTISGNTRDWEFERLNNAVYERLMSTYAHVSVGSANISKSMAQ